MRTLRIALAAAGAACIGAGCAEPSQITVGPAHVVGSPDYLVLVGLLAFGISAVSVVVATALGVAGGERPGSVHGSILWLRNIRRTGYALRTATVAAAVVAGWLIWTRDAGNACVALGAVLGLAVGHDRLRCGRLRAIEMISASGEADALAPCIRLLAERDSEVRMPAMVGVATALPVVPAADLARLTAAEWGILSRCLRSLDSSFVVSVLSAIERARYVPALPKVERLMAGFAREDPGPKVRAAAESCLGALRRAAAEAADPARLLRPSAPPPDGTLLRPAAQAPTDAAILLRPVVSPGGREGGGGPDVEEG